MYAGIAPASATEKPAAIVVFFSIAIEHAHQRRHHGAERLRQHDVASTWMNVMPSARAASACPAGTVLMPERTASQTKARGVGDQRDAGAGEVVEGDAELRHARRPGTRRPASAACCAAALT